MENNQRIDEWTARLQREVAGAAAILLKGSHARGTAGPYSDIDFDVLVDHVSTANYLAFFEDDETGMIRHVSVAVEDIASWTAEAQQAVTWAYGLPAAETTRLVWARNDELRRQCDHPARIHPPEEPELEDFIEAWGKMCNALHREDELGAHLASQKLARCCPGLLRPINPDVLPSNRREAMDALLAFPIAPAGYRDDLLQCFRLTGTGSSINDLYEAARRLIFGTIELLGEHSAVVVPLLPDDLASALTDGRLDRYIRQLEGKTD